MKLFKRLMTALLAGVLAMGMLAGCSCTGINRTGGKNDETV